MRKNNEILIDVSRLIWRISTDRLPTGIDRVCLAYVAHFRERAQAVVQWKGIRKIIPREISQKLFDILLTNTKNFRSRIMLLISRHAFTLINSEKGRGRFYLNVGHSGLDQPGLLDWIKATDVKPIYMLHDLIPITHAEYCRPGGEEKHARRLYVMLNSAAGIIGNSNVTLKVMSAYATSGSMPTPPTLKAWLGAPPLPSSDAKANDFNRPFFITLGTIEGRKNHLMLLTVWQRLVKKLGASTPMLLIIGQRGWQSEDVLSILDAKGELEEHVVELSRCEDTELAYYLSEARALLFPSFAEGYGMPLIEALGIGAPVIASNLEVFHELAGSIPEYLEPSDIDGWQAEVERYTKIGSLERAAQIERMNGYVIPTWAKHFEEVDRWLETLLK